MYECIDAKNMPYSIDQYCLLKKDSNQPRNIYCPFCNSKLSIRAENSKKKTHFMHTPGTSCSSIKYEDFFNSNGSKKSSIEILSLKFNILSFSYNIFIHIQNTFNIKITTQEFINILTKIVNKKVLKLSDVTPAIIPYIWINELGKYKNKLFLYTNSFNETDKIWNLSPTSEKDVIICVNKNNNIKITRAIIPVDTSFLDFPSTHIPISFIRNIIPEIFTALNIHESYHDLLIRDLLSSV